MRHCVSILPLGRWYKHVIGMKRFELQAGVAQLAEHNVANVVVVGSNPITRSLWHETECGDLLVGGRLTRELMII